MADERTLGSYIGRHIKSALTGLSKQESEPLTLGATVFVTGVNAMAKAASLPWKAMDAGYKSANTGREFFNLAKPPPK